MILETIQGFRPSPYGSSYYDFFWEKVCNLSINEVIVIRFQVKHIPLCIFFTWVQINFMETLLVVNMNIYGSLCMLNFLNKTINSCHY